jgi:hypothetical protein
MKCRSIPAVAARRGLRRSALGNHGRRFDVGLDNHAVADGNVARDRRREDDPATRLRMHIDSRGRRTTLRMGGGTDGHTSDGRKVPLRS